MIITLLSVFLTLNSYNFSLKISQSCCKAYCYVPCRSFTVFLCLLPGRTLNEVTFNLRSVSRSLELLIIDNNRKVLEIGSKEGIVVAAEEKKCLGKALSFFLSFQSY